MKNGFLELRTRKVGTSFRECDFCSWRTTGFFGDSFRMMEVESRSAFQGSRAQRLKRDCMRLYYNYGCDKKIMVDFMDGSTTSSDSVVVITHPSHG